MWLGQPAISSASARQTDLDWIRISMTLVVVLYHCSMFFNPQPWHVKNNVMDNGFIFAYTNLVVNWMMLVFFAVSGISAYYSLQKRDSKGFLKERLLRLGVPLAFGMEASMPIYVLHQPVIVTIGYLIYALRRPVPAKLLFLLAAASLVIMLLYHFVIRRNRVLRVLFGMKAARRLRRK
ncbi:acyltransferase family protein [Paenibacillus sp. KN14-4R]|uniref:acyltransferase family protein n=1 Tax=Paenibacillus sp. KN14-4R TaxID=3445773 RepID=UPI003F9FA91A